MESTKDSKVTQKTKDDKMEDHSMSNNDNSYQSAS